MIRNLLLIGLIAITLVVPFVGADDLEPIKPELTPVVEERSLDLVKDVEYRRVEKSVVDQILEFIGISKQTVYNSSVEVYIGEKKLAVLPSISPLVDISVHEYCLENYQFGTDAFVTCEATI